MKKKNKIINRVKSIKKITEIKKNLPNPTNKDMKNKALPDNIDEYFAKIEGSKEAFHSRELFRADKDVDLKTDLTDQEIVYINTLFYNDALLESKGLKPVFKPFLEKYMRLKFSRDRKSRTEFVNINKSDKTDEAMSLASNIANITGVKK